MNPHGTILIDADARPDDSIAPAVVRAATGWSHADALVESIIYPVDNFIDKAVHHAWHTPFQPVICVSHIAMRSGSLNPDAVKQLDALPSCTSSDWYNNMDKDAAGTTMHVNRLSRVGVSYLTHASPEALERDYRVARAIEFEQLIVASAAT